MYIPPEPLKHIVWNNEWTSLLLCCQQKLMTGTIWVGNKLTFRTALLMSDEALCEIFETTEWCLKFTTKVNKWNVDNLKKNIYESTVSDTSFDTQTMRYSRLLIFYKWISILLKPILCRLSWACFFPVAWLFEIDLTWYPPSSTYTWAWGWLWGGVPPPPLKIVEPPQIKKFNITAIYCLASKIF